MAPRPVRVLAVTGDFFPIEGTRRTVARCKRLWELYGAEDKIDLVDDESTHAYTRPLANAAAAFFARHLLDREARVDDAPIAPFEQDALWCTSSGQVRGELDGAAFVYDENQGKLAQLERKRSALPTAERRERATAWLREKVHR